MPVINSSMSLKIKRIIGRILAPLLSGPSRRIILIYHAVGSGPLSLSIDHFSRQMEWLAECAKVEPLEELISQPDLPGLRVALTFDDGYHSVFSVAAPILAKHAFPATVYLNTGMIAENEHYPSDSTLGHYPQEEFLDWPEVVALDRCGWTIGSHGVDHVDLTKISDVEVMEQLQASRKEIVQRLGKECRHFCYTWGNNNQKVRNLVRGAGYQTAVAAIHAPLRLTSDPMALERIDVRREYCLKDFIATMQGDWDFLAVIQRLRRLRQ